MLHMYKNAETTSATAPINQLCFCGACQGLSGPTQMKPPGCFSALVVAANNLNMLLTVVSELNIVQYLLYLQQQCFYGNFSYAASPERRDVSVV